MTEKSDKDGASGLRGSASSARWSISLSVPHSHSEARDTTEAGTALCERNDGSVLVMLLPDIARTTVTALTPAYRSPMEGSMSAGDPEAVTLGDAEEEGVCDRVSPATSGVWVAVGVGGLEGVWDTLALEEGDAVTEAVRVCVRVPVASGVRLPDTLLV